MKEYRIAELRTAESADSKDLVLAGTPVLFNVPATITEPAGEKFVEVILPGALDGADLTDVRLLYNHDASRIPLARTPRTMSLSVTEKGLEMVAHLPSTEEAKAVYESVKRGDLSGMSFAFVVADDGDSYESITDFDGSYTVKRTIRKIKKLYECSVCIFPAYPQTSVEARGFISMQEKINNEKQKAKCLINSILLKRI